MTIFTMALAIFFTFNAVGNIPLFIALLKGFSPKRQLQITFREVFIALILMLLFAYFGQIILNGLGISIVDVRIGGGIILFLIALNMIFPKNLSGSSSLNDEPFIVPLAIPILTGPGTITTVMLYTHQESNHWIVLGAILLAWTPSMLLLMFASFLQRVFGEKILLAIERLMGMILTLIAVQMFGTGILEYVKNIKQLIN